jgi:hypothetical protein
MEVIYRAERTGQLSPRSAALVRWLLERNPAIAEELAISLRMGDRSGPAGQYNPIVRLATIFTSNANDGTAAHEILHHAERLMPEAVRDGIRAAWRKRVDDLIAIAERTDNTEMRNVLGAIVQAYYGDPDAQQALRESFAAGTIPYSVYHLSNPSEFWAVNATDLIGRRAEQTGWVGAARTWLSDFIETVKDLFGLPNDAAIITGLKAILAAESGTIQGQMLASRTGLFFAYAGERAQFANTSKLLEAQALEAAGAVAGPAGTTREKTGWFRGVDNKWRFEINDRPMGFKQNHEPLDLVEGHEYRLGDVITHPRLFKQYPDLENVKFKIMDTGGAGGYWDWRNNRIVISKDTPRNEDLYLNTLIHEMQHAIQTWEGFAFGASFTDNNYPVSLNAINKALNFLKNNRGRSLFLWDKTYHKNDLKDMQLRLEKARDGIGADLDKANDIIATYKQRIGQLETERKNRRRKAARDWLDGNHPEAVKLRALTDRRVKLGLRKNDFSTQRTPEEQTALDAQFKAASNAENLQYKYVQELIANGIIPKSDITDLIKQKANLDDEYNEAYLTREKANRYLGPVGADRLMYYLTAGEVEARDVEDRRRLYEDDREVIPPYVLDPFAELQNMIVVDTSTNASYAPPVQTETLKPSFLDTLSPEKRRVWQQSKEAYEAEGVTSGKQAGYEVPDYTHSLFQEGINSVTQGKAIPSRQQLEEAVGPYNADYFEMGVTAERNRRIKATVMRQPGKTAAEKILNMAQAEVDAMPKEDMVGQVTPYTPEYETIRAKPGINAARMAKMLGPQLYGDPTNMGQVCIKEVLQNSFDATRTAINAGQITQGEISVTISKDGRTLTVKDNGIGMTPQLLGGKFLEIAGTAKEGDKNAGGFGIAKMLFLYANKNIRVSTARDGRIAEMDVTGEQLFDSLENSENAPDITIREFDPVDQLAFPDGHGTIIQLTIPEESGDYKIRELPRYIGDIASLGLSPLFANIKVTLDGSTFYGVQTVNVGVNFPTQDYTQFVGVKFPWGVAKVYVTREQIGQQYGSNMHILSNGLWQFSTEVNKDPSNMYSDPVPYRFYVDIVPSVKPDEPGYPFNFNRQNFTDDAKKDFGKIKSYIDAIYAYKSRSGEATSFGSVQYFDANGILGPVIDLTPSIPVQDTSFTRVTVGDQITVDENGALLVNGQPMPELTPDELKAGIPSASDLKVDPDLIDTNSVMVHDNADVVINATGEKLSIPDYMRRQFGERFDDFMRFNGDTFLTLRNEVARVMGYKGLRDEAIGVSFDPEYRGVSIRLPFSGSFINPLVPVYGDGLRAGYGIFGTMIHELAHHKVRSHNANFPAEMQNILLNMEADEGFAYQRFKDNFADTITNKYGDIVKLGVELFNGKNPDISVEYRGNRFTDGSGEQVPEGAGDGGAGGW